MILDELTLNFCRVLKIRNLFKREKPFDWGTGSVWLFLWYSACILFVYVALTGPVFKLAESGKIPKQTVWMYYPIHVVFNGTPIEEFLKWYCFKVWKCDDD